MRRVSLVKSCFNLYDKEINKNQFVIDVLLCKMKEDNKANR